MESVLLVSCDEKMTVCFRHTLENCGCDTIKTAHNSLEVQKYIDDCKLVIINAPLQEEFGDRLAVEISQNTDLGIILAVPAGIEEQMETKTAQYGIFVLGTPLNEPLFRKAVRLMEAVRKRLGGVKKENIKLKKKIEDIRLINRAKYILMEYLSMTEPQAHRYLEKQAMDLRITKTEAAKRLLSTYDN